jgi:HAD superfamily hydrolase (TIGR01509 family)
MSPYFIDWLCMPKIEVPEFIKGLIFDCDGTLVDSMPLHMEAWKHTIESHGAVWQPEFFFSIKGMPEADIVARYNAQFGADLDPLDTVNVKHKYFRSRAARLKPIPDVMEIARRYRGILPMAVASGGVRDNVILELGAFRLLDCFEAILTADDDIRPKPAPDLFLEAARRMGVLPQYCQVFEDGDLGLQAARAAGMIATDIREFID